MRFLMCLVDDFFANERRFSMKGMIFRICILVIAGLVVYTIVQNSHSYEVVSLDSPSGVLSAIDKGGKITVLKSGKITVPTSLGSSKREDGVIITVTDKYGEESEYYLLKTDFNKSTELKAHLTRVGWKWDF